MTIKEQIAQMERQQVALRELRELLTEPWEVEPERTEAEELRAQLQHQAAILQRIVDSAEPLDQTEREAIHGVQMYELILDAETLESIRTASRYPAILPPRVTADSAWQDIATEDEECPF